ncbi:hypothetical protein JW851_04805 [Candidatus Woesearchaeota archaeon]|nr:hypothetical protein [Candidatus Woesearchaeota archaeon]
MKVHKELPLAEMTLRRYEKPYKLSGRSLVKKLCLSIGLLQPGDGRDVIVDILFVILRNKGLNSKEIEEKVISFRKKNKLPLLGIASSNIRRQLKRLKDIYLIERVGNTYRLHEDSDLPEIFSEKIESFYLKSIKDRVREYFEAVHKELKNEN